MKIAVTGIGIISAIGNDQHEVLASLRAEQTGIGRVHYLPTVHTDLPVGEVKLSDAELRRRVGIGSIEAISRTALLGIMAAREAVAQAGVADLSDAALVSGTTVGGMDTTEQYWAAWQRDENLSYIAQHEAGASTESIARHLGAFSRTTTVSTACSSALNAIELGANMLRTGVVRRVVAGGAECLSRFHLNGFRSLMILDHDLCRPFDATRAGLNLGEGAAYLVLEDEQTALARGAAILGYVAGYGNACDAFHQTASSPDGNGAYLAMQQALTMASIHPKQVDYINAHGTATPNNDASESHAIRCLFGSADALPLISSTKAFTGHTTSASGSIEAAICLLCMHEGFVPANLHWTTPEEGTLVPVQHNTPCELNYMLCNSFGFGGNDSALLLSRHGVELSVGELHKHEGELFLRWEDVDPKNYISPAESRRLTPQIRKTLAGALHVLSEHHCTPDAIVCSTRYGCMVQSMALLQDMLDTQETSSKPTQFMQSTHNTMASLVAIHTHNTGYNITHSNGANGMRDAILDIEMQFALGMIHSALFIDFDEAVEVWNQQLEKMAPRVPDTAHLILFAEPLPKEL